MTQKIERINPVRSTPPVKLRKVRRKGEDGQGGSHTWDELLEDEMKFQKKKKKEDQEEKDNKKKQKKKSGGFDVTA